MLAVGASLLVAASLAGPASSSTRAPQTLGKSGKTGGTININLSTTDFEFTDPSLEYENDGWQVEYVTEAFLLTYAEDGKALVADAATGFPIVSKDGKTYTFTVKKNFKFNTGEPVTAASFAYAFNRCLNPAMSAPCVPFANDIVGAQAVVDGKAKTASGIVVKGNTITFHLMSRRPDFLVRLATPFFGAMSTSTPLDPKGVNTPAGAGPYYIASRDPGHQLILKKNPHYGGTRPRNADTIVINVNTDINQSLLQVKSGQIDLDIFGLPPTAHAQLAAQFGVNKSQYRVNSELVTDYLTMNTSRPFFASPNIRKAVNYAIDRPALLRARGFLAGKRTDQVLPPNMPGYTPCNCYPKRGADPAAAKKLSGGKTGTIVFYGSTSPVATIQMQVAKFDLAQIGINADIHQFPFAVRIQKEGHKGEPFDLDLQAWGSDYADPVDFLDILLNGNNIAPENNNNNAYFNVAEVNKKFELAASLLPPNRYKVYGALDVYIMKKYAPLAPFLNRNERDLISSRIDPKCYKFQPIFGVASLNALCLK
jgi:ABC-type transport system substrate-binding protein